MSNRFCEIGSHNRLVVLIAIFLLGVMISGCEDRRSIDSESNADDKPLSTSIDADLDFTISPELADKHERCLKEVAELYRKKHSKKITGPFDTICPYFNEFIILQFRRNGSNVSRLGTLSELFALRRVEKSRDPKYYMDRRLSYVLEPYKYDIYQMTLSDTAGHVQKGVNYLWARPYGSISTVSELEIPFSIGDPVAVFKCTRREGLTCTAVYQVPVCHMKSLFGDKFYQQPDWYINVSAISPEKVDKMFSDYHITDFLVQQIKQLLLEMSCDFK